MVQKPGKRPRTWLGTVRIVVASLLAFSGLIAVLYVQLTPRSDPTPWEVKPSVSVLGGEEAEKVTSPPPTATTAPVGKPIDISIENAGIDKFGLTSVADSKLAGDPVNRFDINWWSKGGAPGLTEENSPGTVRLTQRYYCHTSTVPGATCENIAKLEVGDIITVRADTGVYTYTVTEILRGLLKDKYAKNPLEAYSKNPEYIKEAANRLSLTACDRSTNLNGDGTTRDALLVIGQLTNYQADIS